jgi:hypothetical protein
MPLPSISARQQHALNFYCTAMREIKLRVKGIEDALNGKTGLPNPLVQEFCYLQLRMICELIVFGCLMAHGDIPETAPVEKEWSAGTIIAQLGTLHPDFYPIPMTESEDVSGMLHIAERSDLDILTKQRLIKLNGRCGDFLHRGTTREVFRNAKRRIINFAQIAQHTQRILNLLTIHSMVLFDGETVFYCALNVGPERDVDAWICGRGDNQ